MPDPTAETPKQMVDMALNERQAEAVAALLDGLKSEMSSMGKMDVTNTEPATIYHADRP